MAGVKLSDKQITKLAQAQQKAGILEQKYQEARMDLNDRVELVLDAHGIEVSQDTQVQLDLENGRLVVADSKSDAEEAGSAEADEAVEPGDAEAAAS